MGKVLWEATGLNGKLELLPDRIVVRRTGSERRVSGALRRAFEVSFADISAVKLRAAAGPSNGQMQLVFSKNSAIDAFSENSKITFNSANQWVFERMKQMIEERLHVAGESSGVDMEAFDRLASLRMRGLITEEEFQSRRKNLRSA